MIAGGRQLLKLREDLITAARTVHSVSFLPMRLGFSSFVDQALYELVCSVHKSLFPACEIAPRSGDNVELLDLLDRGEIDAAVLTFPVTGLKLKSCTFTQSRLVLCMKSTDPLAQRKEITPSDIQTRSIIFRQPEQHPEAHARLIEMLDEVGIRGDVASTTRSPNDLQWMIKSGHGYALIREGSELQIGLVTRPIAGVTWTVDSALILGKSTTQGTIPPMVRELRRRLRSHASSPMPKAPRSVRPKPSEETLPLFG